MFLLDTSALLTLMEDESGADRVQAILAEHGALIPWMTLLEAYYISLQKRGQEEADRRYALMKRLPATFPNVLDEPTLLTAGRIKALHRLSLADAIIAAVAVINAATLVHKDPEFETLTGIVTMERLPYKSASDLGQQERESPSAPPADQDESEPAEPR